MNDALVAKFIDGALRNSDKITIVLEKKKLGKSMHIFDHSLNKKLGSAFLYNSGKLRKWLPAKQIAGKAMKQLITRR